MLIKIIAFYSIIAICAIFGSFASAARSSYGEECSKTQKCDRKAWLSCVEGKCDCSKPDEMLYDEERKVCVVKSGERCKYGVEESGETSLVEIMECVTHANCSSTGLCECDSKHHEIFNGTCGLSLAFGQNCSVEDQCSKYDKLHCVDGNCQCKDGEAQYSEEESQCIGLHEGDCIHGKCISGANCLSEICMCDSKHFDSAIKSCVSKKTIFQNCTRHIECMQTDNLKLQCLSGICNCPEKFKYSKVQKYEYSQYEHGFRGSVLEMCAPIVNELCPSGYCMENAVCDASHEYDYSRGNYRFVYKKCKCSTDQFPNRDSTACSKSYEGSCTSDGDCIDDLVCSNSECKCPSPGSQFFEASTRICTTKIGGICTKAHSSCIQNSQCVLLSADAATGHCQCNEDFVVNKDEGCERSYGTDCTQSPGCDSVAGLVCMNNKCSCPDVMYSYSSQFRKCLGLVGAKCDSSAESNICVKNPEKCDMSTFPNLSCVFNASCHKEHPVLAAKCKCMDGYEETGNHTCQTVQEPKEGDSPIVIFNSSLSLINGGDWE